VSVKDRAALKEEYELGLSEFGVPVGSRRAVSGISWADTQIEVRQQFQPPDTKHLKFWVVGGPVLCFFAGLFCAIIHACWDFYEHKQDMRIHALVEELQDGEKSHEEETDVGAVVDGGENAPLDMVVEEVEDSCPECNGAGCDSCKGRTCPLCHNILKVGANICLHCGDSASSAHVAEPAPPKLLPAASLRHSTLPPITPSTNGPPITPSTNGHTPRDSDVGKVRANGHTPRDSDVGKVRAFTELTPLSGGDSLEVSQTLDIGIEQRIPEALSPSPPPLPAE